MLRCRVGQDACRGEARLTRTVESSETNCFLDWRDGGLSAGHLAGRGPGDPGRLTAVIGTEPLLSWARPDRTPVTGLSAGQCETFPGLPATFQWSGCASVNCPAGSE